MMTQDKETLREAVARTICKSEGIDPDLVCGNQRMWHTYLPAADAAIATMFERLRTPSEGMVEAYFEAYDGGRVHMKGHGTHYESPREAHVIGLQAMLAAFQQENNDER